MKDKVRDLVTTTSDGAMVVPHSADYSRPAPDESLRRYSVAGWAILAIFFGGFGVWSMTAPLNGAVVANAVVKVQGNRKSVQHLEGGIVREMKVKEGDHVKEGDVLVVLDDTQNRSEFDVYTQQINVLKATEARLRAELDRAPSLMPPPELAQRMTEPDVRTVWTAQQQQFQSRRASLEGQRLVLREKINQLREQIAGNEKQVVSFKQQIESVNKELTDISPLVEKGLITQPRKLQLERSQFGLEGQIAATTADIARARQAIEEQTQQIAQ